MHLSISSKIILELIKIKTPIIFTTAYDQYAIKAFKVNSVDYLLKPIEIQELEQSLEKFKELNQVQNANTIELKPKPDNDIIVSYNRMSDFRKWLNQ